jgi:hypothetical protein
VALLTILSPVPPAFPQLSPPALLSPENGRWTNDNTPFFDWTAVSGADSYQILVDNDSSFTSPEINDFPTFDNYTPTVELPEGTYYWKVRARNTGTGESSDWSATWMFGVDLAPPPAPSLLSPGDGENLCLDQPTLTWTPVSDPTGVQYHLLIDNDQDFSSPLYFLFLQATSHRVENKLAENFSPYYWKVVAVDGAGNENSSAVFFFRLKVPPSSRVDTLSPYWQTAPFTVTATASDNDGWVENVELWYCYSPDNSSWGGWQLYENDSAPPYSFPFEPPANGFYRFYSRAWDERGNYENVPLQPDTECGYDNTPPAKLENLLPENSSVLQVTTLSLGWASLADLSGISYELILDDESPLSEPYVLHLTGLTENEVQVTLEPSRTYYWEVRAIDGAGNAGPWSDIYCFTISIWYPLEGYSAGVESVAADWRWLENWAGGVAAPHIWKPLEDWACSALAASEWRLLEQVEGRVEPRVEWRCLEGLAAGCGTSAEWGLLEGRTGTLTVLAGWRMVDSLSVSAASPPSAWSALEIWSEGVLTLSSWKMLEGRFCTVSLTACWTALEGWTSNLVGSSAWCMVESVGAACSTPWGWIRLDSKDAQTYTHVEWSKVESVVGGGFARVPAPVLLSPPDGANINPNLNPLELEWENLLPADNFLLQVDNDQGFSSPEVEVWLGSTSYSPSGLADNLYWWRVMQFRSGENSAWSEVRRFRVDTVFPSPCTLLFPAPGSNVNDNTPLFRWGSVPENSLPLSYWLEIDNEPAFNDPVMLSVGWIWDNSYQLGNPLADGVYYWRVKVRDNAGNLSLWSSGNFRVDTVRPVVPAPLSPVGYAWTTLTPTLEWGSVPENSLPVLYQAYICESSTFDAGLYQVYASPWLTENRWTAPVLVEGEGLEGKVFYWRVRARDNAGNLSDNSTTQCFRTDNISPSAPVLLSPENSSFVSTNPTLSYSASDSGSGVGSYWVQIFDESWGLFYENTQAENQLSLQLPAGAYWWRVRARDAVGNLGAWSDNRTFLVCKWRTLESWEGATATIPGWRQVEILQATVRSALGWQPTESWVEAVGTTAGWIAVEERGGTVRAPAGWLAIESRTVNVQASASWCALEGWGATVRVFAGWAVVEGWGATVQTLGVWSVLEGWSEATGTVARWQLLEGWIGTPRSPAGWSVLEGWTEMTRAGVSWLQVEGWSATLSGYVGWQLLEGWSGTIKTAAAWSTVEAWSGALSSPAGWTGVEGWACSVGAPVSWIRMDAWVCSASSLASWFLLDSCSGTLQAPAVWLEIDSRSSTLSSPAGWQVVESWLCGAQAQAGWSWMEGWSGTIKTAAAWSTVEAWSGTVRFLAQWSTVEAWSGTFQTPAGWSALEGWGEATGAPVEWRTLETRVGIVDAPVAWREVEVWLLQARTVASWFQLEQRSACSSTLANWIQAEQWQVASPAEAQWRALEAVSSSTPALSVWRSLEARAGTVAAPIYPPVLLAPDNALNTNDNTPTFSWENLQPVDYFELQVDSEESFSPPLVVQANTGITSYTSSELLDGPYWWRVRCWRKGAAGSWSVVRSLRVDTLSPVPPQLLSPSCGRDVSDSTPLLRWTVPPENSLPLTYNLRISTSPYFEPENLVLNLWVGENSYEVSGLQENVVYYWKVLGRDNAGNVGFFQDTAWWFKIDTSPPPPPTLLLPENQGWASSSAVLRWVPVPENSPPVLYRVEISDFPDFLNLVRVTETYENGWTVSPPLPVSTYYWRVKARDNALNWGLWSQVRWFRIDTDPPSKPTLLFPENESHVQAGTGFQVGCTASDGAGSGVGSYTIQVASNPGFSPVVFENTVQENVCNVSPLPPGKYYWRARAIDRVGNNGPWSDSFIVYSSDWTLLEQFSGTVRGAASWAEVERWSLEVAAPSSWRFCENWVYAVENVALGWFWLDELSAEAVGVHYWVSLETWSCAVEGGANWFTVDLLEFSMNVPPSFWFLQEGWAGGCSTTACFVELEGVSSELLGPAGWVEVDNLEGTCVGIHYWVMLESFGVEVVNRQWRRVEGWSSNLRAPASFRGLEGFSGRVGVTPSEWRACESLRSTGKGTMGSWRQVETFWERSRPAAWSALDAREGTVYTPGSWWRLEERGAGLGAPAGGYQFLDQCSGGVLAPHVWVYLAGLEGSLSSPISWKTAVESSYLPRFVWCKLEGLGGSAWAPRWVEERREESATIPSPQEIELPNLSPSLESVLARATPPGFRVSVGETRYLPPWLPRPEGEVYTYLDLIAENAQLLRLRVKVEKGWLQQMDRNTLRVLGYRGGWREVPFEAVKEDAGFLYLEFRPEDLRCFAVTARRPPHFPVWAIFWTWLGIVGTLSCLILYPHLSELRLRRIQRKYERVLRGPVYKRMAGRLRSLGRRLGAEDRGSLKELIRELEAAPPPRITPIEEKLTGPELAAVETLERFIRERRKRIPLKKERVEELKKLQREMLKRKRGKG